MPGPVTQIRVSSETPDKVASRCARRCVDVIVSLLRPEEVGEAIREFEAVIDEELAALTSQRR